MNSAKIPALFILLPEKKRVWVVPIVLQNIYITHEVLLKLESNGVLLGAQQDYMQLNVSNPEKMKFKTNILGIQIVHFEIL